jgi:hypothetical protein
MAAMERRCRLMQERREAEEKNKTKQTDYDNKAHTLPIRGV